MTRRIIIAACAHVAALVGAGVAAAADGDIRLSTVISDNCVLQRDMKAPVWGTAAPEEGVAVTFAGQTKVVTADRFGRWRVELDPMPASAEPRPLVVECAGSTVRVEAVYVGDVWLYLSQSWHLGGPKELRVDSATLPPISTNVPASVWEHQNHSQRPQDGIAANARWTVYRTPGKYFRNDGYYVGLGLARVTGAPVGVVGLGASTLESMTPPEGFQAVEDEMGPQAAAVAEWVPHTRRGREAYLRSLVEIEQWVRRTRTMLERPRITHRDFTQPPELPGPPALGRGPTTTYNRLTRRYAPAAMRGIIIQPKTFSVGDPQYLVKAKALILGLREAFGRKDLPVCFVQMHTPGRYEAREAKDPDDWVRMRDAQNRLARIPHTTVLATYDLKKPGRSDPDMGLRAAQWAVALLKDAPVKTGPGYRRHRVDGRSVIVEFDNVGGGLMAGNVKTGRPVQPVSGRGGDAPVGGFQLAGPDGEWRVAEAVIRGETVVVTRDGMMRPTAVRYAWTPEPTDANLYNRDGFPALPFRAP